MKERRLTGEVFIPSESRNEPHVVGLACLRPTSSLALHLFHPPPRLHYQVLQARSAEHTRLMTESYTITTLRGAAGTRLKRRA